MLSTSPDKWRVVIIMNTDLFFCNIRIMPFVLIHEFMYFRWFMISCVWVRIFGQVIGHCHLYTKKVGGRSGFRVICWVCSRFSMVDVLKCEWRGEMFINILVIVFRIVFGNLFSEYLYRLVFGDSLTWLYGDILFIVDNCVRKLLLSFQNCIK